MEKSATNEVSITRVPLKKEEDIKIFAETAMNELLGWYGYDSPRNESKASRHCTSHSGSNDSEVESLKFTEGCGWCGKPVDENNGLVSASAVFCSELCFSQSRRASFKRNKTCDWCRHVRHTVSYVDFQDGASQLQFCSDKCLNQYKMHIFCRETRAHLELHPHLHDDESTSANLITPDLWLRSCKSPVSNKTPSPSPPPKVSVSLNTSEASSKKFSNQELSPMPLITLTPNTKLLPNDLKRSRYKAQKKMKKRCPSTITTFNSVQNFSDIPQDLRVRHTPPVEAIENTDLKSIAKDEASPYSKLEENEYSAHQASPQSKAEDKNNVKAILESLLPPPTTFVPYPVILPLPIPIPIPIPIPKMFKANSNQELIVLKDCAIQTDEFNINNHLNENMNSDSERKSKEVVVLSTQRRPLRKRKRIPETKTRISVKHKKTSL